MGNSKIYSVSKMNTAVPSRAFVNMVVNSVRKIMSSNRREPKVLLGRWGIHKTGYEHEMKRNMDFANYDNCYGTINRK